MSDSRHLIFVNYRGSDEIWATEFVYAKMTAAFGEDAVFKAGNAIGPGEVYVPILREKAAMCPVMLACIGASWLSTRGADGGRRIDAPDDWVRREISISLRSGNTVVPILFGNHGEVSVPKAAELPEDLSALIDRQAWRLAPGGGLDLTVPRLIEKLIELEPELGRRHAALQAPRGNPSAPAADRGSSVVNFYGQIKGDAVGRDKIIHKGPGGSAA